MSVSAGGGVQCAGKDVEEAAQDVHVERGVFWLLHQFVEQVVRVLRVERPGADAFRHLGEGDIRVPVA